MQVAIEQSATDGASILKACRALTRQLLLADSSPKPGTGNSTYVQRPSISSNQQSQVREIDVNGVKFKMIYVAGGTFTMGATAEQAGYENDETPAHQVTLSDYFIGETEVTQELWYAVMGTNPSNFTRSSRNPVENVSWHDCQAFIQKLNQLTGLRFRLPTEAEWEFAARGGNSSKGYKYSGSNRIDDVAWYDGNSGSTTHEVATCYPNELGLYDMSGNVWEWCSDWYGGYSSMAQTDPSGVGSGSIRVFRGGGWNFYARYCRVAYRYYNTPDTRYYGLGLRLVCSRL
ncbi:MAG: formylglycine-generating enzyme family protein [Muribaculaceae bacterium]|nr:formylglycine-generating enzyme family protein [Muribaculaceae bacterium]